MQGVCADDLHPANRWGSGKKKRGNAVFIKERTKKTGGIKVGRVVTGKTKVIRIFLLS